MSSHEPPQDPLETLDALAGPLHGLRPDEGFSDAVMAAIDEQAQQAAEEPTTSQLQTLAAELDGLRPDDRFTDAVMAAVAEEAEPRTVPANDNGLSEGLWRSGVPAVVLAAVAAAACLLLSMSVQEDLDADVLATVDVVEVVE